MLALKMHETFPNIVPENFKNICRKAGQKLSYLSTSPYLDQGKKVLLYKSMIKSKFNCCPLVLLKTVK